MLSQYITRNGNLALIDGISDYYIFGEEQIILSGTVDGIDCAWDKFGRYRVNVVLGIKEKHELDLIDWVKENRNDGLYYFENKGKNK